MKNGLLFLVLTCTFLINGVAQDLDELELYTIDKVYMKMELSSGSLDEDGREIEYIFTAAELERGTYQVELADGPNNLYKIKGTELFITFNRHFGYASSGTSCLIKVDYYEAIAYKLEN